jgi:hypothetical protein
MSKIKRNELCSCGSGKKYKKCCGSPAKCSMQGSDEPSEKLLLPFQIRKKLGMSKDMFNAIWDSGLLGPKEEEGIPEIRIEEYERYGTQWLPEENLGVYSNDSLPEELINNEPHLTFRGLTRYAYNLKNIRNADLDTGWLVHFYLKPNRYMFLDPASLALVGPIQLKLLAKRKIVDTTLPVTLYPDPQGSLALIEILGVRQPVERAYEIAYDVASPILDELSLKYDQPLPIAQSTIIGIPSGTITVNHNMRVKVKEIKSNDIILSKCPFPELKDAVALYREAISSNNPFHQFLTFWKVYENVCKIRGNWRKEHKRHVIKIKPETISEEFGRFASYTFEKVRQELIASYRHAIAHGELSTGKPKTAASSSDITDIWKMMPLIRYMARTVLENVRATLETSIHL